MVGLFAASCGALTSFNQTGRSPYAHRLLAVAVASACMWMVWAMGRLLAEEQDEYLAACATRALIAGCGLGTLLAR